MLTTLVVNDRAENISVRILSREDLRQYHDIRLECLKNHPDEFGTLYEEELSSQSYKFDKHIKSENTKSFLMGAFTGREISGICGFIRESKSKSSHRGTLCHFYVKKELQHSGIGKLLMSNTVRKAFGDNELELIELSVVNNNRSALKLYRDAGFVEYGRLDKYFKHGDRFWPIVFMYLSRDNFLKSCAG